MQDKYYRMCLIKHMRLALDDFTGELLETGDQESPQDAPPDNAIDLPSLLKRDIPIGSRWRKKSTLPESIATPFALYVVTAIIKSPHQNIEIHGRTFDLAQDPEVVVCYTHLPATRHYYLPLKNFLGVATDGEPLFTRPPDQKEEADDA